MDVVTADGGRFSLGTVEAGATVGIIDFSRRVTDDFGVTTVVQRGFSRRLSVRLAVPSQDADGLQRRLADLRSTAARWIADDRFAWLSPSGFYKDFDIDLAVPPLSFCTLTVEGLAETEVGPDAGGDPAPNGESTLRLLQPFTVTDAALLASSVAENDAPAWAAGTGYVVGAKVLHQHRVYEAVIANTGKDPAAGGAEWLDTGPSNRWSMFDQALGTVTAGQGEISVTIEIAAMQAVALLDVTGATVRVTADGYDRTQAVTGGAVTFLDLGAKGRVTIRIAGAGAVSVGTVLVGKLVALGLTEASPTAGITDFSRKDVDDFGEVTIVKRGWAKRMTAKALIRTDALDLVANRIAAVRAVPSLWIGQDGRDSLTIYGFFKDFGITADGPLSKLSLSIEGLSAAVKSAPIVNWEDVGDPKGTKPTNGADKTSDNVAKDTAAVGGRPAGQVTTAIDANKAAVEQANRDISAARAALASDVQGLRDDATKLNGRVSDAVAASDSIASSLSGEIERAKVAEGTLTTKVQQAQGRADDAYTATTTETVNRLAGDSVLAGRQDITEAQMRGERDSWLAGQVRDTAATSTSQNSVLAGRQEITEAQMRGERDSWLAGQVRDTAAASASQNSLVVGRVGTIEAQVGNSAANLARNGTFAAPGWGRGSSGLPPYWVGWDNDGNAIQGWADRQSMYGAPCPLQIDRGGINNGIQQYIPGPVAPGWYVFEVDVVGEDGNWSGSGIHCNFYNGSILTFGFATNADTAGRIGDIGNAARRYTVMFKNEAESSGAILFLMAGWVGFQGNTNFGYFRTIWHRVVMRPASAGEIKAQQVESISARINDIDAASVSRDSAMTSRIQESEAKLAGTQDSALAAAQRNEVANRVADNAALSSRIASQEATVSRSPAQFRVTSRGASASNAPFGETRFVTPDGSVFWTGGRSYLVIVFDPNSNNVGYANTFDVFGDGNGAANMAALLNGIGVGQTVVIATNDEPQTNRFNNGLDNAMARIGAGEGFFSSNFRFRSAYVLIGRAGAGRGGGVEFYKGATDSDANAFVDEYVPMLNGRAVLGSNGGVSQVRAALNDQAAAQATQTSALTTRIASAESRADNLSARVDGNEGTLADVKKKVATAWSEKTVSVPGAAATVRLIATDNNGNPTSNVALLADVIALINTVNGQPIAALKAEGGNVMIANDLRGGNGRIIFDNGSVMKVMGTGFGSSSQFIEWFGPRQDSLANCTEQNASYYLKTDGSSYFGGSLSAGTIKNAIGTSSTANNASVTTGTVGSRGGSRVVVLGYSWSWYQRVDKPQSEGSGNNLSAQIILSRNGADVATLNASGSWDRDPTYNEEPGNYREAIGGSLTFTDNSGGSSVEYSARLVSRNTGPGPENGSNRPGEATQRISIVQTEQ